MWFLKKNTNYYTLLADANQFVYVCAYKHAYIYMPLSIYIYIYI